MPQAASATARRGQRMAGPCRRTPVIAGTRLPSGLDWHRPALVLQVETRLPVVERHVAALDEDVRHLRPQVERIPRCNEQVRELSLLDRADLLVRAEDLR